MWLIIQSYCYGARGPNMVLPGVWLILSLKKLLFLSKVACSGWKSSPIMAKGLTVLSTTTLPREWCLINTTKLNFFITLESLFAEQAITPLPQLPTAQTNSRTMTNRWKIHSTAESQPLTQLGLHYDSCPLSQFWLSNPVYHSWPPWDISPSSPLNVNPFSKYIWLFLRRS